jgi:antibiotic biosynthesis monooxygenase (ABM) superfamily enzyme
MEIEMNPFNTPKTRMALLMIVGVYPIITAYLYVLMPLTDGWQMWQRTILLVPLMVATIVFGLIPTIQKHFGWFIAGKKRTAA